ncbi:MAG: hypothetical protein QOI10_3741 [Solirubrobacterales bacterium]|jgi:hypothetical protein|nr:hypothetical protein [Solirubrobacterales bacterium]
MGTAVDGELVVMTGPRIDFQALQRRLATRRVEASATLVAFDLLAHDGADLGKPQRASGMVAMLVAHPTSSTATSHGSAHCAIPNTRHTSLRMSHYRRAGRRWGSPVRMAEPDRLNTNTAGFE